MGGGVGVALDRRAEPGILAWAPLDAVVDVVPSAEVAAPVERATGAGTGRIGSIDVANG